MRIFTVLILLLMISGCQQASDSPNVSDKTDTAKDYFVPEIDIPGLGVDHRYVAHRLYAHGVNYNLVYQIENPDEIRDKIRRLSLIPLELRTQQDTMVVFSVYALRSTLNSRLAKNDETYYDRVSSDLKEAIALIEGKNKYRTDLAFEKLALGSMYFMKDDLNPAIAIITSLVEDFTDISIPGQPMYISRSALITYFQMMSAQSARENSAKYLNEGATYLEKISENYDNELGAEADNLLFRYYNFIGEHDRAGKTGRRLENRSKR